MYSHNKAWGCNMHVQPWLKQTSVQMCKIYMSITMIQGCAQTWTNAQDCMNTMKQDKPAMLMGRKAAQKCQSSINFDKKQISMAI